MNTILEFILKTENAPVLLGIFGAFAFLWLNRELKIIQNQELRVIKESLTNHITGTDKKIDKLDTKIDKLGERLDTKIDKLGERLDTRMDKLDTKVGNLDTKVGNLDSKMNDIKALIVKSMNQKDK